jgi:hypothetical protein
MSNLTLIRIKNWLRGKWPLLVIVTALIAVAVFGFGVGYIVADRTNRAPIIINQVGHY